MFTAANVIAALRVPAVARIYNRAYTMLNTNGIVLVGSRRDDLVPRFNPAIAHLHAAAQTAAILNSLKAMPAPTAEPTLAEDLFFAALIKANRKSRSRKAKAVQADKVDALSAEYYASNAGTEDESPMFEGC